MLHAVLKGRMLIRFSVRFLYKLLDLTHGDETLLAYLHASASKLLYRLKDFVLGGVQTKAVCLENLILVYVDNSVKGTSRFYRDWFLLQEIILSEIQMS
jgi:hypothetical protein